MKKLGLFSRFDTAAFLSGKVLIVTDIKDWIDFDTKKPLGRKVEVVIIEDKTVYPTKDGQAVSNLFEKFTVKVPRSVVDVSIKDRVTLVNPVGTVYGDYRNLLSITADNIVRANPQSK